MPHPPLLACLYLGLLPLIGADPSPKDPPADLILLAGRVWTGDSTHPWAEGVAIRGPGIVRVGARSQLLELRGPATQVLDFPNGLITPGLIDAHGHMSSLGASLEELDLRGVASLEEVRRLVAEARAERKGEGWILGRNWDQSLWPGGEFPDASLLDLASPDQPVWLTRVDGHAGWANSAAMKTAGIDRQTQAPSDGQILKGPSGDPTGIFVDGAMSLIERFVPAPNRQTIERRLLLAQQAVLSEGLVSVHDAGISLLEADVYRALASDGRLKLRIYAMASPPSGHEVEFVSTPPAPSSPSDRFRMRAIKLFIDGAMGSRGALLNEPYADDPHNKGLYLIEPTLLQAVTRKALETGWQVCTHAIGDKGNRLVLDAYLAAQADVPTATDPRLRVEHAQVVDPADIERFAKGRIIASMQPSHASTDQRWADRRLGPDRVLGAYAWRWFADAHVPLAFGSDFPVEIVDPLWGLFAAVTRKDLNHQPEGGWHPEHLLTLHEALRGFTSGAAHAAFSESSLGILRPSMRADLTVFSNDLFRLDPTKWLEVKIEATVIDGEIVYRAN